MSYEARHKPSQGWYTASTHSRQGRDVRAHRARPLDVHFFYQTQIEFYYRDRNTQERLNRAINACQRQIAYAATAASAFKRQYPTQPLPSHKGYTQLAIIFERQKKYPAAINLCSAAKKDGWYGDWGGRIARCNKKLESA